MSTNRGNARPMRTTGSSFNMYDTKNSPPEETKPASGEKTGAPASSGSAGAELASPAGDARRPALKKLWGYVVWLLDYIDEQEPKRPEETDAPQSKLKKCWKRFNAFLDSLDEKHEATCAPESESEATMESSGGASECSGDRGRRPSFLKKAGSAVWTVFFHAALAVFFFTLTLYGTVKSLDFINERRLKLYPPDEVTEYLTAAHETLEETASELNTVYGKCKDIPIDKFDAKTVETLKPLKIYSDEYGVYLMTSRSWYDGEHGVFIARDADNMPPTVNWGWIEGRVFAYGIYD